MNPKYGDVYKWKESDFKVMYVGPNREEGWDGVVLADDQGRPSNRDGISYGWVNSGVTRRIEEPTYGGWVKIE